MALKQKELVDQLKVEWKKLWQERVDDKFRAEGIAINDYSDLFIDQGTIIHATRDFKVLNFKDILREHEIVNAERYIPPDPSIGGWTKFVKETIPKHRSRKDESIILKAKKEQSQQRKNGRGWLHK